MGRRDGARVVTQRRVAVVVVVVAAASAVTVTGAVDLGDELLAPADQIYLQPAPGPNGAYATLDGNDELRVDIDGAMADGKTVLQGVFVVGNTGTEPARVWVTDDTASVDYVAADCGLDRDDTCRIRAGETVAVGVIVDAEKTVSTSSVTIHARVPGANDSDPNATVTGTGDGVRIEASGVGPTEGVTANVSVGDENVSVESVSATTTERANLSLSVDAGSNRTAAGTDVPEPTASTTVGYLRVDHESPTGTFDEVAFRVTVERDRLAALGREPGAVQLLRYHDGSWERIDTTAVNTTGETLVFRGVTPGLSTFAVAVVDDRGGGGVANTIVPPTAAVTGPETAAVGEPVTLDASATTDNAGVVRYRWDTDGDGTVETVSGTATVEWTFDTPGRQQVRVTAVDRAGLTDEATTTVTVEQNATTTPNVTTTPSATATSNVTTTPNTTTVPNATTTPNTVATETPDATTAPEATETPTATPTATATESPGSETEATSETTTAETASTTATPATAGDDTQTSATGAPVTEAFGFPAREFGLLVVAVLLVVVVGWYRSRL